MTQPVISAAILHLIVDHEVRRSKLLVAEATFYAQVSTASALYDAGQQRPTLQRYRGHVAALQPSYRGAH